MEEVRPQEELPERGLRPACGIRVVQIASGKLAECGNAVQVPTHVEAIGIYSQSAIGRVPMPSITVLEPLRRPRDGRQKSVRWSIALRGRRGLTESRLAACEQA